jgi:hypothetical protein
MDDVAASNDLGAFQILAQVTLSQFPCQVGLRFAYRAVNRSVVVVAFVVIAAEINPG